MRKTYTNLVENLHFFHEIAFLAGNHAPDGAKIHDTHEVFSSFFVLFLVEIENVAQIFIVGTDSYFFRVRFRLR